jgi:hypothetical protein
MTDKQARGLCADINRLVGAIDKVIQRSADLEYRLCWHFLASEADRWRALNDAREWIKRHLVKSKEKQNVRALKHVAEHAGRGHLTHKAFRQALREAEFTVEGVSVFASIL